MSKNRLSRHITWHIIIILGIYNVFVIVIAFFFNIVVSTADSKTLSQHIIDCVVILAARCQHACAANSQNGDQHPKYCFVHFLTIL